MAQVLSPVPGTFYTQAAPGEPQFKQPGDSVASGDVIGLIEVMKTFIEVKAEASGTFKKFLVEDGAAINAGQPLAELEG
ncbi:MAG TPA: biotin carboxyl carrier domain-containing protein [Roseobacter sp.]|uniref:Biotin carboxyl carrier protein of acetyl-CoA carboxylase n=1 Tax=marine sediment metagenome TaxID=412755 RepID=A0A0F9U4H9_9ZZZZ|nr:biotin carboxyl carrier domain-containing protein [Roseobacter sp.]HEC71526.1 biotin carboxyl carrier domain-containing protein [Roseobacter sp.]|tara:strand:+ start:7861 stop:8097 length:237 start_codon:yes stop_codon:yes gene_type:complete